MPTLSTRKSLEIVTIPVPLGVSVISPFEVETISLPLTSKSPPNCGVVSSTIFPKPPLETVCQEPSHRKNLPVSPVAASGTKPELPATFAEPPVEAPPNSGITISSVEESLIVNLIVLFISIVIEAFTE